MLLYLKHHTYKTSWIRKPNKIHQNLIPTKLTNIRHSINFYTTINGSYNWSAFLAASCLNIGYMSSYELIRICN